MIDVAENHPRATMAKKEFDPLATGLSFDFFRQVGGQ
jgi:hypothetical protein